MSDSFSFKTSGSTGGLVGPGTITIAAPAGTVLPAVAQLHDDTTNATFTRSGVRSNSNATLTVSLCCTDAVNPSDHVTVTLDDVTNAATGGHTLDVSTSSNPSPVATPSYTLTAPEQADKDVLDKFAVRLGFESAVYVTDAQAPPARRGSR